GNDTIDLSELHELFKVLNITDIPPEDVERRFRQLDTNRSNSLDYLEFLAMFLAIKDQYQCTPEMAAAVLEKKPSARTPEDVERLSYFLYYHVPFFAQFNKAMRLELCRHMRGMEYEEGDWLYTQGASADAVFIPLEGVVSVWAKPVRSDAKDGPNDEASKRAKGAPKRLFDPPLAHAQHPTPNPTYQCSCCGGARQDVMSCNGQGTAAPVR
ncbi:hypothetical protein DUNSADRAFT_11112, partial [Dunaliella salina]